MAFSTHHSSSMVSRQTAAFTGLGSHPSVPGEQALLPVTLLCPPSEEAMLSPHLAASRIGFMSALGLAVVWLPPRQARFRICVPRTCSASLLQLRGPVSGEQVWSLFPPGICRRAVPAPHYSFVVEASHYITIGINDF